MLKNDIKLLQDNFNSLKSEYDLLKNHIKEALALINHRIDLFEDGHNLDNETFKEIKKILTRPLYNVDDRQKILTDILNRGR